MCGSWKFLRSGKYNYSDSLLVRHPKQSECSTRSKRVILVRYWSLLRSSHTCSLIQAYTRVRLTFFNPRSCWKKTFQSSVSSFVCGNCVMIHRNEITRTNCDTLRLASSCCQYGDTHVTVIYTSKGWMALALPLSTHADCSHGLMTGLR